MSQSIGKITINFEGKWHLQIYIEGEYDLEEDYSEYFDTLEECYSAIRNYNS